MPQLIIGVGLFALGASLGSFANVFILRKSFISTGATKPLPNTLSGRSICPHCRRQLSVIDLVPVISWLMLLGRCRRCRQPISAQYPTVELAFAVSLAVLFLPLPITSAAFFTSALQFLAIAMLIILFIIDLKTLILPDKYIIGLALISLLVLTINHSFISGLQGAAAGAGILSLLWLVTRGKGLGLGDVKLMIPVGLLLGFSQTGLLLFLAFTLGGVISLILLATKQVTMKTAVPFGPYLAGLAIVFILFPNLPQAIIQQLF